MKVSIDNVNLDAKTCNLYIGENTLHAKLVLPTNKGSENDMWVDLRPYKALLGAGDHKNWITVSRATVSAENLETEKKPSLPLYVSLNNLMNYVTPDEYEIARQIFAKATLKLNEEREKAGYKKV